MQCETAPWVESFKQLLGMGSKRLITGIRSTFPRNNNSIFNPDGLTISTCDKSFSAKKSFSR